MPLGVGHPKVVGGHFTAVSQAPIPGAAELPRCVTDPHSFGFRQWRGEPAGGSGLIWSFSGAVVEGPFIC